jgi:uncharacterized protein YjdB
MLLVGLLAIFLTTCGWIVRSKAGPVPKLASITVTPANPSIPVGVTQQFAASGTYSDKASHDITTQVTWRSSKIAVATVNSSGLATSVAQGTATMIATSGKISGRMTLTVTSAALSSIAVTPTNLIISVGSNHQFRATGRYSDGTSYDITPQVTWGSSNPSVATVNKSGLATAVTAGTATITASLGTVLGNRTLAVTSLLSFISVTPDNPIMPAGSYKLFTATGTYSDGTSNEIRNQVTWSSSNAAVAKVSHSGMVTAVAAGLATITATQGSISGETILTVTPLTLSSISVTNPNQSMPAGVTQQFRATGIYSEGTISDITTQVTWSSSNPSVATVNSSGLVTAVETGTATITATFGGISGNTVLKVT